jgi:hypothetical protein
MIQSDLIYAINKSELGKARCLNCGDRWGDHAGIKCQKRAGGDHTFQPLGYALSDRCSKCGKTLLDHHKRAGCFEDKNGVFTKYREMFTDEEFLL